MATWLGRLCRRLLKDVRCIGCAHVVLGFRFSLWSFTNCSTGINNSRKSVPIKVDATRIHQCSYSCILLTNVRKIVSNIKVCPWFRKAFAPLITKNTQADLVYANRVAFKKYFICVAFFDQLSTPLQRFLKRKNTIYYFLYQEHCDTAQCVDQN